MSDESITPPAASNKFLNPSPDYVGNKIGRKFIGDCLKQEKITFNHGNIKHLHCKHLIIVNIYIVYEIEKSVNTICYPTLENCLFGAVKLIKYVDIDQCNYSGYGIGFDSKGVFSHPSGGNGRNVIIFGVDMSSSPHTDN